MKMQVGIKDIAQKLNLTLSSVSRALNNKPGVSDETRYLVVKTAKEMGYRPNVNAQGLASGTGLTKTIGVIIPDIINPIFGEIMTGIIETASKADYNIFICISDWDEQKKGIHIQMLQQKRVDGIIIEDINEVNAKLLEETNVPVVVYESYSDEYKFTSVNTDNEKGGYIAAKHLLECGYKKTACLQGPATSSARQQRQKGFLRAYEEAGTSYDESLIYLGEYNLNSGYNLAQKMFREHPETDSIFAGNDVMAFGILKYMSEHNIKAGRDCGLIGFDNINLSNLPQFKLSTIKQPKYNLGRIMTKILLDEISARIEGFEHTPLKILLEPKLIIRKTTCMQE